MSRLSDKVFLYWVYELQPGLTSAILEHNLNHKTLESLSALIFVLEVTVYSSFLVAFTSSIRNFAKTVHT